MAMAQGDPVTLDKVDAYVVVLNDGRLNVRYTLTFTELESGRDRIRELGPFPELPHYRLLPGQRARWRHGRKPFGRPRDL